MRALILVSALALSCIGGAHAQTPGEPVSQLLAFSEHAPHGSIEAVWYASPVLGHAQRRMLVYLPPAYHRERGRRFPVLFLLHGGGGDEESWTVQGRAPLILDNLIASGAAAQMIVVMPNGIETSTAASGSALALTPARPQAPIDMSRFALDRPQMRLPYQGAFSESLVRDIVPFVERTYRVKRGARHRAIAGLSLGAAQTVVISSNNPGLFAYVGVFSGGGLVGEAPFEAQLDAMSRSGLRLYWTGAGDDDISRLRTTALYRAALAHGLPATYRQIPGTHTWPLWRDFLVDFAPRLFR